MQKKKLKLIVGVVYVLLVLAITAVFVGDFVVQATTLKEERTNTIVESHSQRQQKGVTSFFRSAKNRLIVLSKTISHDPSNKEAILRILQADSEIDGSATVLMYTDHEGSAYTENGKQENELANLAYNCMSNNIPTLSEPFESAAFKNAVMLSVPVRKENDVIGAISRMYYVEQMETSLFATTEKNVYGFVFSEKGNISFKNINSQNTVKDTNVFDFLKKADIQKPATVANIEKALMQGENIDFVLTTNGVTQYARISPLGEENLYIFCSIDEKLIQKDTMLKTDVVVKSMLKLLAVVCLIILFLLYNHKEKSAKMRESNQKFARILSNLQGGIITFKTGQKKDGIEVSYISDSIVELTGYTKPEINELFCLQHNGYIHPDDFTFYEIDYMQQTSKRARYHLQYRIVKKDGSIIWIMDKGSVISTENGKKTNQSVLSDITEMKSKEKELLQSTERLRAATEQANCAIFDYDLTENRFVSFVSTEKLFLIPENEMLSYFRKQGCETLDDIIGCCFYKDDVERIKAGFEILQAEGTRKGEVRLVNAVGEVVWVNINCSLLFSDNTARVIGFITDINELKTVNETLRVEAENDPMTGICNKKTTQRLTKEALLSNSEHTHALLVIDIDNFKGINDTLGHLFGDAVLIDVSAKLKRLFRDDDIVGRIGGDEFVVFMRNANSNVAARKAQQICDEFKKNYTGEKANHKVSCSVGVCVSSTIRTYDEIFSNADKALYQAKNTGKDRYWIYTGDEMQAPIKERKIDEHKTLILSKKDRVFQLIYNAVDFETSINMVLMYVADQYKTKRIYVFENDTKTLLKNTIEWYAENEEPLKQTRQAYPKYYEEFDSEGILCVCPHSEKVNSDLPKGYQVAIFDYGKPMGIIGFDMADAGEEENQRKITELSEISKILGMFILKHRAEEKANPLKN